MTKKYRSNKEIEWEIILATYESKINEEDGLNITQIMRKANLNYNRASYNLNQLTGPEGPMVKDDSTSLYTLSARGDSMMEFFRSQEETLKKVGVYPFNKPVPKPKSKVEA